MQSHNRIAQLVAWLTFTQEEIGFDYSIRIHPYVFYLKELRGVESILVFNLVMKECIPQITILFFSECLDFKKHFLTLFIRIQENPEHTMCSPKGWLNASTASGHKLMPSTKR